MTVHMSERSREFKFATISTTDGENRLPNYSKVKTT